MSKLAGTGHWARCDAISGSKILPVEVFTGSEGDEGIGAAEHTEDPNLIVVLELETRHHYACVVQLLSSGMFRWHRTRATSILGYSNKKALPKGTDAPPVGIHIWQHSQRHINALIEVVSTSPPRLTSHQVVMQTDIWRSGKPFSALALCPSRTSLCHDAFTPWWRGSAFLYLQRLATCRVR